VDLLPAHPGEIYCGVQMIGRGLRGVFKLVKIICKGV